MQDIFEIGDIDLAGRLGLLRTGRGEVRTPALLPVIHPYNQQLPIKEIQEIGFQAVMTNAYITMKKFGGDARRRGIHNIIGFDGPIMTDSGGYQVLEYGEIGTNPLEMARFEEEIGSDFAIILDTPTGRSSSEEDARKTVELTLTACKETLEGLKNRNAVWVGPVQGGRFLDLVEKSAKEISAMDFEMIALGSPTVVMETYNFTLLARMILAAKRVLPAEKPFHLFGLGHPLPLSLAVALGCDTFDSASYMLYARDGRYITDSGTRDIQEMVALPCICPICANYAPEEIARSKDRALLLAKHNLYILWKEIKATRQAIREGRLWEYVGAKARAHPKMWEAFNYIAKNTDYFEKFSPIVKDKGVFISGSPDDLRPEVERYDQKFGWISSKKKAVLIIPDNGEKPFLLTSLYSEIAPYLDDEVLLCCVSFPFGLIPAEVSDVYPFSQVVASDSIAIDPVVMKRTKERVRGQLKKIKASKLILVLNDRVTDGDAKLFHEVLKPSDVIRISRKHNDVAAKIKHLVYHS